MADPAQDTIDSSGLSDLPPDPVQLQGHLQDQYNAQQAALANTPAAGVRSQLQIGQGLQTAAGGDPRVQQAKQQQAQIKAILAKTSQDAPENEDPLDYQSRLSTNILATMGQTNPQLAMQASQRLVAIQQAKQQREVLGTEVAARQATTSETLQKLEQDRYNFAAGKTMPKIAYVTPPPNADGSKSSQPPIPISLTDENGEPRTDHEALAQEFKAAQQVYPGGDVMSGDQLNNARVQAAQLSINRVQIQAQAEIQKAMIAAAARGNPQGLSGNAGMMATRMLSSATEAGTSLINIANMSFGARSSWGGLRTGSPGASLFDSVQNQLQGKLTDDEVRQYNVEQSGLMKSLQILGAQGGLQGGINQVTQLKDALTLVPSDTPASIMAKLAHMRQIVETSTKTYLANPQMPEEMKQPVRDVIDQLAQAVPFKQQDVTNFIHAQDKNPNLTYRQWAQKNLGNGQPPGATPAPSGGGEGFDNERNAAANAIANGKDPVAVKARYKQRTGKDFDAGQ